MRKTSALLTAGAVLSVAVVGGCSSSSSPSTPTTPPASSAAPSSAPASSSAPTASAPETTPGATVQPASSKKYCQQLKKAETLSPSDGIQNAQQLAAMKKYGAALKGVAATAQAEGATAVSTFYFAAAQMQSDPTKITPAQAQKAFSLAAAANQQVLADCGFPISMD